MFFLSKSLQLQIIQLSHCDNHRLLIQGSRPFPTPGSSWTSERTSMFEVAIKTFERCSARPERNKAKESGRCWTDWTEIFFLWISKYFCGCNWFDLLAMDCPNKNSRVWPMSSVDCIVLINLMASLRHSEWDTGLSDLMEQHNWQLKA